MDKKYIRIYNKTGQDIVLEQFIISANSSLDIPEQSITDYMWRRICALNKLNRISYSVIFVNVSNPLKIEPDNNTQQIENDVVDKVDTKISVISEDVNTTKRTSRKRTSKKDNLEDDN